MNDPRYFVSSRWPAFYPADPGLITFVDVTAGDLENVPVTGDTLSDPSPDDLLSAALSLWPRGAAWGSPDGVSISPSSVIAKLTAAILSPFADLYRRAWQLTLESRAATLVDTRDDWETEFAVPGECIPGDLSDAARARLLREAVAGLRAETPADMIRLADRLGFVIAIYEPEQFRCGVSSLGLVPLGVRETDRTWVVMVRDVPVTRFETGIGETGVTRLTDFEVGELECALERVRPAWSFLVFNYGPHEDWRPLADENGAVITDVDGAPISIRILDPRYYS